MTQHIEYLKTLAEDLTAAGQEQTASDIRHAAETIEELRACVKDLMTVLVIHDLFEKDTHGYYPIKRAQCALKREA